MPPRRRSPRNGGTEDATIVASASSSSSTTAGSNVKNVNSNSSASSNNNKSTKTKLKLTIKRWHGVAKWSWGVGSGGSDDVTTNTYDITSQQQQSDEDDVCIVCQTAFEGVAPGVKYPGDECPVVWGKCGHAFHLQCVSTWLSSQNSTQTCPTCRAEWEYGAVKAVGEEPQQQQAATGGGVGAITGGAGTGAPLRIHI
jgi:anaphase-promoting complex subunit 11